MNFLNALTTFPFLQRALLAGVLVAAIAGLWGVFVVLRRMAFFSDAVAHIAVAGIAVGIFIGWLPFWGALVAAVVAAVGIGFLIERGRFTPDTAIGVFFSGAIAFGVLLLSFLPQYRGDLFVYLFGDILAVTTQDLVVAGVLLVVTVLFISMAYSPFVRAIFVRDLAIVDGVKVRFYEYAFLVLLAVTVAASIKVVGAILVSALVVLPAATARNVSGSLKQMFAWSVAAGVLAALAGLMLSYTFNVPTGPTIVLVSLGFFLLSLVLRPLLRRGVVH